MKRAIIWCAVSTQAQSSPDKISLDEQERLAREWCDRNDHIVVDLLTVPGHSRAEADIFTAFEELAAAGCHSYHRLRDHIRRHDFDTLVAYDSSRIARSQTLFTYVVENTINAGAEIYLIQGGRFDEANGDFQIAIGGIAAKAGVKRLVALRDAAMDRFAALGLPTSKAPCMSHRVEYDPVTRKAVRLILDESKLPMWNHLHQLIMDRIAYSYLEHEMYMRFAYVNPNTGRPYAKMTFYSSVIYNPNFWGHTGRYFDGLNFGKSWVYDDDVPPPPGILLFRHTIPPVFTGDQASRLKQELRRRETIAHGKTTPNVNYPFTGLLMCGACGSTFTIKSSKPAKQDKTWAYYCCTRKLGPVICPSKNISQSAVQSYLDSFLAKLIATADLTLVYPVAADRPYDERADLTQRLIALRAQMEDDLQQARASRAQATKDRFRELADQAAEQIEILESHLSSLVPHPNAADHARSLDSVEHLVRLGLSEFWKQEPGYQNQLLHALFGRQRLLIRDGQIVGIATYKRHTGFEGRKKK